MMVTVIAISFLLVLMVLMHDNLKRRDSENFWILFFLYKLVYTALAVGVAIHLIER